MMMMRSLVSFSLLLCAMAFGNVDEHAQLSHSRSHSGESSIVSSSVLLRPRYPVLAHDKFGFDASSAVQTFENRVSEHHSYKLRVAHNELRSKSEVKGTWAGLMAAGGIWASMAGLFEWFWAMLVGLGGLMGLRWADSPSTPHAEMLASSAIRMTNLQDSQYVGPLTIGSNGDIVDCVFDTGSTNIWIASTLCHDAACEKREHRYDPKASTTYTEGHYDLRVTFGTGELSGFMGTDDIGLGTFSVRQQNFNLIEHMKGRVFEQLDFGGIVGLAFPSMSANKVTPFFDQVINQKLLKQNQFAFYFSKLPMDASAAFFGDISPELYQGELAKIPVTEQHYWLTGLNYLKIGDKIVPGINKVVFDSGTTYSAAPKHLLSGDDSPILGQTPSTKCSELRDGTHKLPHMEFSFAGHDGKPVIVNLEPKEYYVGSGGDARCDPAWMAVDVPAPHGPAFILGEVFMRDYFTVFSRGDGNTGPEVQIAKANHDEKVINLIKGIERAKSRKAKKAVGNLVTLSGDNEAAGSSTSQ